MLGWLRRRRERTAWVEAEAEALSRELGVEAYSEARRREREANSIAERTLSRAKADLKIIARKDGPDGGWTWRLPPATGATRMPKDG